jgi:hypothetical protein
MKVELQNTLFEKYPKIFVQKDLPMTQTCMCWGVEAGDGWYDIIDTLCHQIQWYLEHNLPMDEDPEVVNVQAVQVKEKFGTLRFYYNGGNEFISGLISMAEGMSGRVCECCGAPGRPNNSGWISTQCEPCREKQRRMREEERLRFEQGTQGGEKPIDTAIKGQEKEYEEVLELHKTHGGD